ncbi:hypothetical protein [Dyella sp.]|uniref:hypothetical protein n=1 Tax=Dyella sp. TaxID=1869338 RepID=UPI002FDB62BF
MSGNSLKSGWRSRQQVLHLSVTPLLSASLFATFPAARVTSSVDDGKDNRIDPIHDKINAKKGIGSLLRDAHFYVQPERQVAPHQSGRTVIGPHREIRGQAQRVVVRTKKLHR